MEDDGHTMVLEAIILALILLGAAYSVTKLRETSLENAKPRANLERVARDSMVVLAGLQDDRGPLLGLYLDEAYHCRADPVPSATSCQDGRSANLTLKIESYLPPGAGYAIALDNGIAPRDIYRSVLAPGETVSAQHTFVPQWNMTFLATDLSCYEAGMSANATLLPLDNGRVANVTFRNLTAAAANFTAEPSTTAGHWNVTLPAATRPATGTLTSNLTGRDGALPGATKLATCNLGGAGPLLVSAIRETTFGPATPTVGVGQAVAFEADLATLFSVPGATLVSANVTVYEPIPARAGEADTWAPAAVLPLALSGTSSATWSTGESELFGIHPAVLTVKVDVGGVTVEARRVSQVAVALPTGEVPIDPPYRAILQAWFPDWR